LVVKDEKGSPSRNGFKARRIVVERATIQDKADLPKEFTMPMQIGSYDLEPRLGTFLAIGNMGRAKNSSALAAAGKRGGWTIPCRQGDHAMSWHAIRKCVCRFALAGTIAALATLGPGTANPAVAGAPFTPGAKVMLNPQPLPPRWLPARRIPLWTLPSLSSPAFVIKPGNRVSLNPQPLPPRVFFLRRR
jgi:hypothetical protein